MRVSGVDVSSKHPLSPDAIDALRDALVNNCVLILRAPTLSEEELVLVTSYFGKAEEHKRSKLQRPDRKVKEIVFVSNMEQEGLGNGLIPFHNDMSYVDIPAHVSVLHCVQTVKQGGETRFGMYML